MQKDIDTLYQSLVGCLEEEYNQYQDLLKLLREEALIIKKSTLEHILESNARKEIIVLSLNMTAEMRLKAIKEISAYLKFTEPASMTQIIASARDNTRQILLDYQEKFADVIDKTKKVNEDNKNMISFSLSHIRNTFNYINSLIATNQNYNHHGQIKAENLHGRLISQAG